MSPVKSMQVCIIYIVEGKYAGAMYQIRQKKRRKIAPIAESALGECTIDGYVI